MKKTTLAKKMVIWPAVEAVLPSYLPDDAVRLGVVYDAVRAAAAVWNGIFCQPRVGEDRLLCDAIYDLTNSMDVVAEAIVARVMVPEDKREREERARILLDFYAYYASTRPELHSLIDSLVAVAELEAA